MNKKEQYRAFCKSEKGLPIFSQAWHLDVVTEGGEWDVALVIKSGKVVASYPFFVKKSGPFSYITQPLFSKLMGPYIVEEFNTSKHENSILKELIEQVPEVDAMEQNFHYSFTNWLPFYWAGFQQTTAYTYVLQGLNDLDQTYARLDRHYRNKVIPSAAKKLRVTTDRSLEDFYRVFSLSFQRQNLASPLSLDYLKKYDAVMAANHAREIFFAVDEQDQIHSVLYLAWDGRSSYYHLAGDDPALRNSGSGIFLTWQAIKYTQEVLALDVFDFEGSMIPGIEKVRRKFGAKQMPYFFVSKTSSKVFGFLRWVKGVF